MNNQAIAARYRDAEQGDIAACGYVLIYAGRAIGWKRELITPETVCPGVLAVDLAGQVFEAQGGNDYDGASRWVAAQHA
ncbi:MAG: antirestriction protein ArdR [Elusimicrobiota bacterium]|jgi:hypothetical protein